MNPKSSTRQILAPILFVIGIACQPQLLFAEPSFVALPKIENKLVAPRLIYIENPRFPKVEINDLWKVFQSAADLVQVNFGVTVKRPGSVQILKIDEVFADLIKNKPANLDTILGDFRNDPLPSRI